MRRTITTVALIGATLAFTGSALAQSGGELRKLLDELNVQIDKAEKERLADPWFLRDLRGDRLEVRQSLAQAALDRRFLRPRPGPGPHPGR